MWYRWGAEMSLSWRTVFILNSRQESQPLRYHYRRSLYGSVSSSQISRNALGWYFTSDTAGTELVSCGARTRLDPGASVIPTTPNQQLQPTPNCSGGAQRARREHCAPAGRRQALSRRG